MDLCETRGSRHQYQRIKHCGANTMQDRVYHWMNNNDRAMEVLFVLSSITLGAILMLALAVGMGAFR